MPKRTENTGEDIFRFIQSAFAGDKGADHQEEPADVDIPPIEYKDQRVITTELLAQVYETNTNNIKVNFARNKEKFKKGIHYFLLEGDALRQFKDQVTESNLVEKNTAHLYLWTERGANRHCKILDTPKAWEQFDNLEETYFIVRETARMPFQYQPAAFYPTKATSLGEVASYMKEMRIEMEKAGHRSQTVLQQSELTCRHFGLPTLPNLGSPTSPAQLSFSDMRTLQGEGEKQLPEGGAL